MRSAPNKVKDEEKPLAIVCADLHLSMKPPAARQDEPSWFEAMAKSLRELRDLSLEKEVPVLCAGDIFDRWNSPPELINFALKELPSMYVIAGQHDLPYHAGADIEKSALGTLIAAGHVVLVPPEGTWIPVHKDGFQCYGFGWNEPVREPSTDTITVCLHHAYRYSTSNFAYANALEENQMNPTEYEGFDFVITGDNHISWEGFLEKVRRTIHFFNPGSFMRRNSDQLHHRPRVGLLYRDRIEPHYLNIEGEKFNAKAAVSVSDTNVLAGMTDFLAQITNLKTTTIDFADSLTRYMKANDASDEAQQFILEALEHARNEKR